MAQLHLNIPHSLPKDEALQRIRQLLTKVKKEQAQYISGVQEKWEGDQGQFQFIAKGFDVSGLIHVKDNGVDINADLPFALSFFSGMIKKVIHDQAQAILASK